MPNLTFFDAIEMIQERRATIFSDDLGIEVCPYLYDLYGSEESNEVQFGLLKAYDTSSVSAFAEDIAFQTLVNPLSTFIGNLLFAGVTFVTIGLCLFRSLVSTIGLAQLDTDEEPLMYAAVNLLATPYFLAHAVIDPAWELLAAVTRPLSTLGSGVINAAHNCVDYCTADDRNASRGTSSSSYGGNKFI